MEYSASMVSTLLWWSETQAVAQLLQEGKTKEDIIRLAKEDNIFTVRSVDRRRRIAGVALKRVAALPQDMAAYLATADFRTAQVIVLLSVMATERIFKEFCEDVLYQAMQDQTFTITDEKVAQFMNQKMTQSAKVASFSDSALKKLKQTCIKFLYDGGILTSTKAPRLIQQPLVTAAFEDCCRKTGMAPYYRILTGRTI